MAVNFITRWNIATEVALTPGGIGRPYGTGFHAAPSVPGLKSWAIVGRRQRDRGKLVRTTTSRDREPCPVSQERPLRVLGGWVCNQRNPPHQTTAYLTTPSVPGESPLGRRLSAIAKPMRGDQEESSTHFSPLQQKIKTVHTVRCVERLLL